MVPASGLSHDRRHPTARPLRCPARAAVPTRRRPPARHPVVDRTGRVEAVARPWLAVGFARRPQDDRPAVIRMLPAGEAGIDLMPTALPAPDWSWAPDALGRVLGKHEPRLDHV